MPTGHYVRTDAHRAAISAGQRRRVASSPEVKAQISKNLRPGNHSTEAGLARNSTSKAAWWKGLSEEARAEFTARRGRGVKQFIAGLTITQQSARLQPRVRAGAAATKQIWARLTPQQKIDRLVPVWRASQFSKVSSLETTVAGLLDALGISYQHQAQIDRWLVDFLIPSRGLVIECDGAYWHGLPGNPERDAARDVGLRARGFDVLRLPESDITSGACVYAISRIAS